MGSARSLRFFDRRGASYIGVRDRSAGVGSGGPPDDNSASHPIAALHEALRLNCREQEDIALSLKIALGMIMVDEFVQRQRPGALAQKGSLRTGTPPSTSGSSALIITLRAICFIHSSSG